MKNLKYTVLIAFIATLISCNNTKQKVVPNTAKDTEQTIDNTDEIIITKAQFDSNKMELSSLIEKNFPEIVVATGMLDAPPQSKEVISSYYDGFVKKSNLLVGDRVRKGQALVSIENPEFIDMQQEYLETKEQIGYLKSEFERQKTLFEEKITSQKNYQKAKSEYKRKVAILNGLKNKLKLLNININRVEQGDFTSVITLYSSINGSISEINVSKGSHVAKADKIMEIINSDFIHIELKVFEKDAMKIKKGQIIRFKIPEISDTFYKAKVTLIGKSIDDKSRTISVYGRLLDHTKNSFNVGMFVNAQIEINTIKALSISEDAVVEEGDRSVILKLVNENDTSFYFEPTEVKVKKNYAGFSQISVLNSNEMKPSDKILIKGAFELITGEH